jgi:hypothetical protein
MKTFCLTTITALILLFCTIGIQAQSDQLTLQQKNQIIKELRTKSDSMLVRWQRLDPVGVMQYYSPDLVVASDSSLIDFQTYTNGWIDFNKSVASVVVTLIREDFTFVKNDIVISTVFDKDETVLKSGDKIIYNPHTYVTVYKKEAGQWRGIYLCASGIPAVQPAEKK